MYNEIATYAQDEDMKLTVENTYASVDVEVLSTEESEAENGVSFTFTNTMPKLYGANPCRILARGDD